MPAIPRPSAEPPVPLNAEEEALMRAIGRLTQVLGRTLDNDLVREQRMSLSEYTVLRHLSEHPARRMRMSELAAACDMSLSGMTRLAGRLAAAGLLRRTPCENDARGANAALTDAGLARLERAWPTHLASVRRHIFAHLDGVDLPVLTRALNDMA